MVIQEFINRKKVSSGGRWTEIETSNLLNHIKNGCLLSEIEKHLLGRSRDAILAQARKIGYGEQKVSNRDKRFVFGVKYRGSNKEKSTETEVCRQDVPADEDTQKYQIDIVPHNEGKKITLTALDMLDVGGLQISPDSVKELSDFVLRYRL